MQVSDLVLQYQNNLATGSEVSVGTKGVEQLVETAKQLKVGNIFEGTINSIKGNQVILGLSSGQNITARLDAGVSLAKGQSVFFQVKSNQDNLIQIKPVSTGGSSTNPTLISALDAANIPVTEKTLNMVNTMMKEQMSIDASSLQEMSRQIILSKGADPATVVEMNKLSIPVTQENVIQFTQYKEGQGQVISQMQALTDNISSLVSDESIPLTEALDFQQEMIHFFTEGKEVLTENSLPQEAATFQDALAAEPEVGGAIGEAAPEDLTAGLPLSEQSNASITARAAMSTLDFAPQDEYEPGTIGNTMSADAAKGLQNALSQFPEFIRSNSQFFDNNAQLRPESDSTTVLARFTSYLAENSSTMQRESVAEVLSQKGYKAMVSQAISQEWTLAPTELKQEHSVRDLYQKMQSQLNELSQIADKYPDTSATVAQAADNLSQNIDFMNQLPQTYNYVQIPLQMSGQNVNGELIVYRNNKGKAADDDTLTAFLHFDMEALKSVDISVKLQHKNLQTNWYLEDEASMDLIANNMHLLTARLEALGYNCNMNVSSDSEGNSFVDNFLRADSKVGGEVHRYSFDVRA